MNTFLNNILESCNKSLVTYLETYFIFMLVDRGAHPLCESLELFLCSVQSDFIAGLYM